MYQLLGLHSRHTSWLLVGEFVTFAEAHAYMTAHRHDYYALQILQQGRPLR